MKLPKWSDFPTAAKVYLILLIPLGLIPLGCFMYYYKTESAQFTVSSVVVVPNSPPPLIAPPEVHEQVVAQMRREHDTDIAYAVESSTEAPFDYMASLAPIEEEEEYEPYPEEWVNMHTPTPTPEKGMRNVDWVGLISAINTAILSWAAFFYKRRADRKRNKRLVCEYED
jgi:hypothetical protein